DSTLRGRGVGVTTPNGSSPAAAVYGQAALTSAKARKQSLPGDPVPCHFRCSAILFCCPWRLTLGVGAQSTSRLGGFPDPRTRENPQSTAQVQRPVPGREKPVNELKSR